jgi:flavin-dependent dehydrogenase
VKVVRISRLTKEFYRVPVSAREAGAVVNPTTMVAQFALIFDGEPSAYVTGEWETDLTTDPDTYFARITVGGTGSGATIEKAVGNYTAWLKVAGATETPVRQVGQVEIA